MATDKSHASARRAPTKLAVKRDILDINETEKETIMAADLEADIRQLREDVAALAKQLAATTQHGAGTARAVALEGVDHLRLQGEAAIDALRSNARDFEAQLTSSVREKPVTSLAIAAGIGFLFALFTRR